MGRPLYLAALFLNPGKFYKYINDELDAIKKREILGKFQHAFNQVVERMVSDVNVQDKIMDQATSYSLVRGIFASASAIRQRTIFNPLKWWTSHGCDTPELTNIACRILGLCCSSSACERNWSTFEFIHTKKRNRLEHQRLNDLVYIQYNRRLQARFNERREQNRNYDPLLLDELDWSCEWMIGQEEEDIVHDDLTWADVDRAVGASASIEGRNRVTRAQASGSNIHYTRRVRRGSVEHDSDNEDQEVEDVAVNDDEDVDDDFGLRHDDHSGGEEQERAIDSSLFDD